MKKGLLSLISIILLLSSFTVDAQNIRVMPISGASTSDASASLLYNRLNQAVSLNGLTSTDNSNRFLLITTLSVLSMETTTTTPVNCVAEVEVSMFIVDNVKKILMSQEILTKKGVGSDETKAVQEAVKSIKARDPKLKKMITVAKNRIMDYYNDECENIMQTIETYIEMEMYDEALNELNAIPQIDAELDCYKNSIDILSKISKEQQDASNSSIKNETPNTTWINN